jgi:hypothetical protein
MFVKFSLTLKIEYGVMTFKNISAYEVGRSRNMSALHGGVLGFLRVLM